MNLAPHGIRDFYIGRKIFDRSAYDMLCGMRADEVLNDAYFPKYRS